ncbi:glycoside hydrolase family 5 protein [Collybia nuda]|uniref:mannan endo-1,4-beta-mannosidase n=1 Tax=Collybia nuda TaxID=64659 RepID=A0A9P6CI46_9AGAR|nr:glycoside hydrolase family 5 protein [Collybia nuda]
MRLSLSIFTALLYASSALAANSFAGANNYYAFSLPDTERHALLDGMKAAGMKVLRTWVTGHEAGQKGSNNRKVLDLEANGIRNYNDTILDLIDQLMVDAHDRGIKLLIGMHDKNSLQAGDVYGRKYGQYNFYTDPNAIDDFNQRITHILNIHKNKLLGNKPWSELSAHIFGLEAQNEPMIFDQAFYSSHLSWICNTAQQIRNNVGDRNQLIFTGGGSAASSVQSVFFGSSCPAIDVVAIHDYNDDYDNFMTNAVSQARTAGKKLVIEEWGSLVGSGRTANLQSNIQKINNYKVPWFYWELITNPDPHQGEDYEIQVNGADWGTLSSGSLATAGLTNAPFDFGPSLAL